MAKSEPVKSTPKIRAVPEFFDALNALTEVQRAAADKMLPIFEKDPFDPRLKTHVIHKLTARFKRTVWAVCIAGDLRAVFYIKDGEVWSVDIGTHDIYK